MDKDKDVTWSELTETVAKESPAAAGLIASIMEHNAAERENLLPTWDIVEQRERAAYDRGLYDGKMSERDRIHHNIFGFHSFPEGDV